MRMWSNRYYLNTKLTKIFKFFKFLINLTWSLPTVIVIFLIGPIKKITIVKIYTGAFGHLLLESFVAYQKFLIKSKNEYQIVYFSDPKEVNNKFIKKLIHRNLPIKNFIGWQLGKIFYLFFPQSVHYQESPSIIHQTASTHYFRREQKKNFEPFQFLQSEDNIGYSWLKSYGWNINQPFLCVIARDDAYDITRLKSNKISEVKYRNLAISNFGLAVDWLASQGIWIIRMGSIVNSKFDFYNQKLIDYPFDKNKSDFLDIWLLSKCNGIISTGTGPDVLGILNNIPILHVGLSPLISMCSFAQTITLPKKLFDSSNQKYLNLTKTLDLSWDSRNLPRYHKFASDFNYINWGVKVIDPEPLEILSAVKEFWQRLNNVWVESEEDIELQTKFWSIFSSHPFYKINHGWKHPHAYLGASWLKSMGYEFLT